MSDALTSPPFVDVEGISNFRDIGDGERVRSGLLFRAADPTRATKAGLEKMSKDLGIKVIFDLRSAPEIKRDGPEWADVQVEDTDVFDAYGMKREWVPVFAETDYSPEQIALRYREYAQQGTLGFVNAYRVILQHAVPAYGTIFRHLAQPSPTPCLAHCSAGKDRTGVLVALLLLLIDVPKQQIAYEYSLTDQGLAARKGLFTERLLKHPALEGNREGVLNMTSSKAANMEATIEMIEKEFGRVETYMKDRCQMSDAEIESLKKNLRQS